MATLDTLKGTLRQKATTAKLPLTQPLSNAQYRAGLEILVQGPEWIPYHTFIIPQLSELLAPLFNSRVKISVLEIGPGPKSVLGYLPSAQRSKIRRYAAFEPHGIFATSLEEWLCSASDTEVPLPSLQSAPSIHRDSFDLDTANTSNSTGIGMNGGEESFDVILFCHSMYGLNPKREYIEKALGMLDEQVEGGIVVAFHRDGTLHFDGLACHRTTCFPTGVTRVADNEETLDCFTPFIAGFTMVDADMDKIVRAEWREVCRVLGRGEEADAGHLVFSSPEVMVAFNRYATMLPELTVQVPRLPNGDRTIKNREARLHRPTAIIRPTEVAHVQKCVRWALKFKVGLTVIGGGHSGQCLWPNVISVDMDAFDQIHILPVEEAGVRPGTRPGSASASQTLVVAEAGCKAGDIVRKTMAVGVTVPLGARPSVGAGLWLQGGIGHLARPHGLACDAIVGAVVVSVNSGQVLYVGRVPSQLRPAGAVRPENEKDLLWAIKGGGTNFGIVISITFKSYAAPTYWVRNWVVPLSDSSKARIQLGNFDQLVARRLSRDCSADAYLYWDDAGQLQLGVTMFEPSTSKPLPETPTALVGMVLGPEHSVKHVDGFALFDTEMYISGMHGGHSGGKTSSFKRCVFLKDIAEAKVANILVAAMESRPSLLCYLHLLQGGGAIDDVAPDATAFGCRDWAFACVITGVWPRDQDGSEAAQSAVRWVYKVATGLLPLSSGAYCADLGPDPRDITLAAEAFGPNLPRLARLKKSLDPCNILAHACPLPRASMEPRLIILVTGESCVGKDYCADFWTFLFTTWTYKDRNLTAQVFSISDATKREYAAATGADLNRLLWDRAYKEKHRPALTTFYQDQVRKRPQLPEEHFLYLVYSAAAVGVDVLLITGMRDEMPVAAFSHLVPDSRLLEVRVQASQKTRGGRRGHSSDFDKDSPHEKNNKDITKGRSGLTAVDCFPTSSSLVFNNDTSGNEAAKHFAEQYLFPFFHKNLQRLMDMIRLVPDFPRPGINFRHVLGIAEQRGGSPLCTTLLQNHCAREWNKVDVIACCEVGGLVFASPLAAKVDIPLVLIRETGKLPPPTISVIKSPSHISLSPSDHSGEKRMEMNRDLVSRNDSVVVVDDVLATGRTLLAILHLLKDEAGISAANVSVLVVAEFPVHRGRELLHRHGFGRVDIQSLLVLGGA